LSPTQDDVAALADQLGVKRIDTIPLGGLSKETYKKIPYSFVKKHQILPFQEIDGEVVVATSDPLLIEPLEELQLRLGKPVKALFATKDLVAQAIHDAYENEDGAASELIANMRENGESADGEVEVYDLLDDSKDHSPIVKLLNLIIMEAIQQGASDIHFDPSESGLKVRYRIDGVLHNRHAPTTEYQAQLLTRIKVMSKLDIAEHRLPQDGRIKLKMGRREVDFRVSTLPVSGGERIVLRILDKGNLVIGLEKVGMPQNIARELKRLVNLPEGIVLVTGPTGSGKTTTLYSAISELQSDSINIMTIEDPVEYNLQGIAQIAVHHKIDLDFARGLRHILRQDPDVIMVGEIRDKETAEVAIQASLTGHMVLSTLHTNDAPSAITRLVDMGIEPYLLSSSVVGVLAQRLLRKVCPHCETTYVPSQEELDSIGLKWDGPLKIGAGCDQCYNSGYKGRIGVYELMTLSPTLQKQIVASADGVQIRSIATSEGMRSLRQHGSELVVEGVTTIKEVLRVTRGIEGEE
jgi:general secretion pathway protein E